MRVRPATPEDIDRCAELLRLLFSQEAEFTPAPLLQKKGLGMIIGNPASGTVFVCEETDGGLLTGMTVLLFTVSTALGKPVILLEDMIVDPQYRSRGVGSLLVEHAIKFAEEHGFGRITLLTDHDNTTAQEFYTRHGFRKSGMVTFRKIIS